MGGNIEIGAHGVTTLDRERTFRASRVPMCVADKTGLIIAVNPAFAHAMGPSVDRSIPSLFVDPKERAASELAIRTASSEPVVFVGLCTTKTQTRVLSWSCKNVDDVLLAEIEDVIDHVDARIELDALLRALPDIYFRLDANGCIVALHGAREAEFHVPPERLIGQRPQDLLPPDVASLIASAIDRVHVERTPVQIEYTLPTPSGDDRFEAYLVPCGEVEVTALIRNTTARHRAEMALHASEERLRATQKLDAIGQLAGGVAHDFNNLLGVILGRLTFLKRAEGPVSANRDHVNEAFAAAMHAASLTRQLLAFGRRQVMQPKVFDLDNVVASLHEMLQRVAGEHIDVILAPSKHPCPIESDPVQIEQVVLNLVLNARHAMPDGGTITIATNERWLPPEEAAQHEVKPGSCVALTVSDTGIGMSAEVMAHLFEPFFTTKSHGQGTGLGLAMVYGIVKQSGGHTIVRSEPGAGTTFELWFPRASDGHAPPEIVRSPEPSSRSLPAAGKTVLVVEDATGMRQLVVEILRRTGFDVIAASGGDEAIRVVHEEGKRIALVVTDVVMPKMGGRTLVRRIRDVHPDIPVLLMSGYETSPESRRSMGDFDLVPLIEKPFTEDALLARVRDILDETRLPTAAISNCPDHPSRR